MPDNPLEQMRALLEEATADGSVYMAAEVEAVEAFLEVVEAADEVDRLYGVQRETDATVPPVAALMDALYAQRLALAFLYERLSAE